MIKSTTTLKIYSTNIGERRTVIWSGEEITTGIFKHPIDEPIHLGTEDVENDVVVDRRYHGGIDKACYAYSADHYGYWQALYPHLEWSYGMFGENLTIQGLNEKNVRIGDTFKVGKAIVQISEPRQPCLKLNVRFNSKETIKQFIDFEHSGTYFRVLETGTVENGDHFKLISRTENSASIHDVYCAIYKRNNISADQVKAMVQLPELAEDTRLKLNKVWHL